MLGSSCTKGAVWLWRGLLADGDVFEPLAKTPKSPSVGTGKAFFGYKSRQQVGPFRHCRWSVKGLGIDTRR